MRLIARRLVARRLVASIDGSRLCREQEGAHRPPAGWLHPACTLRFQCHEFTAREMCGPRCLFATLRHEFSEIISQNLGEIIRGQDTQDRTGHPGQDTRETRHEIISPLLMSGSTNLNPQDRPHARANKTRNGHTKCRANADTKAHISPVTRNRNLERWNRTGGKPRRINLPPHDLTKS